MNDDPLPGMQVPHASPPKPSPAGVRVTRTNATRLCEKCCRDIHELGIVRAPYPRTARFRVTTDKAVSFLCYVHKDEVISQ